MSSIAGLTRAWFSPEKKLSPPIVDNIAGIERLGLALPDHFSVALQRYGTITY
jgi:hypothetical protein